LLSPQGIFFALLLVAGRSEKRSKSISLDIYEKVFYQHGTSAISKKEQLEL